MIFYILLLQIAKYALVVLHCHMEPESKPFVMLYFEYQFKCNLVNAFISTAFCISQILLSVLSVVVVSCCSSLVCCEFTGSFANEIYILIFSRYSLCEIAS